MTPDAPLRSALTGSDALATNAMLIAVRQSADVICDRWSLSVVMAAFLGARRSGDFAERTGVTGSLLTARMRRLEEAGLFLKVPYSRRPLRQEYRLTNMGEEFYPVLVEMARWERRWFPDDAKPIVGLVQARTPEALSSEPACAACGRPVTARDAAVRVSRSQLQKMPQKQTAHRRSTVDSAGATQAEPLLGASLDILGDKWSIEVINCAFLGVHRFGAFRGLIGIAPNILTDRLARLTAAGFLSRGDDRHGKPAHGYWLTEEGLSFYPLLLRMQDWADAWISDRYRSPVTLVHRPCGHTLRLATPQSAPPRLV